MSEIARERPRCPFYGFSIMRGGNIIDSKGNQCALELKRHSPCSMEYEGQTPDWNECPFNRPDNTPAIGRILQEGIVFPDEISTSRGIPMKTWYHHITYGEKLL